MFSNIGNKIKTLASAVAYIGIVASVITGIAVFTWSPLVGLIIIVAGSFLSWISSFFFYGFGELVENSAIIAGKISHKKGGNDNDRVLREWMDRGLVSEEDIRNDKE